MALRVAALHVYPVKSCAGIARSRFAVDARGPEDDRRWMVVDPDFRFVTQRECPAMALVRVEREGEALRLLADADAPLELPAAGCEGPRVDVVVWRDTCAAIDQGDEAARWLSERLARPVRLVRMADDTERRVNPLRSPEYAVTGFADGYPFLLIGEASLDDLNRRLPEPLPMDRFRPNVVVSGSEPYAEDTWRRIRIGALELEFAKPCGRCAITTTDQATAARGKEPLRTLARYRRLDDEAVFGSNFVHRAQGAIAVGDAIEVLEHGPAPALSP